MADQGSQEAVAVQGSPETMAELGALEAMAELAGGLSGRGLGPLGPATTTGTPCTPPKKNSLGEHTG